MTDPIKHPDAISAIHAVAAELSLIGISKDRENTHQRFKFRGIDDVYFALSPLLAKHGLVILPHIASSVLTPIDYVDRDGKAKTQLNVRMEIDYNFHVVGGGQTISCRIAAEATDTGDKATSKTMSIGYKTMAFSVFCIPAEGRDDPDADTPAPASRQTPKKDVLADLPGPTIALLPIPPSFGTPEHAVAWLPNCKTAERVREWMSRVAKEFTGETDKELIKQGFEKFKRGEV